MSYFDYLNDDSFKSEYEIYANEFKKRKDKKKKEEKKANENCFERLMYIKEIARGYQFMGQLQNEEDWSDMNEMGKTRTSDSLQ